MTQLDIFYRSFENYKKELQGNREDHLVKKAAYSKNKPADFISKINVECKIDEAWVNAIEKSIPYLEKCIKEDRQFIKNEGEVLPIEKIRRVSKDSVSDLAKHSDYITKVPDDPDDLVPEKLLMITRDSDYKIYENRVLYAGLSYIKDFISTRLEKIIEAINKYDGKLYIKKKVEVHNRKMDFLLDLSEKRFEDPIAIKKSKCAHQIERIKLALNDILVLLKTPLMVECAKASLVKRPITKTNILKMNVNFKEALAIYDYCVEYEGAGYEIEEKEEKIYPLSEEQTNAFSDIIQLSSFLAYEYNNHIEDELLEEYKKEDIRRKKAEEDILLQRMEEMYQNAKNSGKDIKEYIYLLEEGTRIFKERLEETKAEMAKLVEEQEARLREIEDRHVEEIADIYKQCDERIAEEQQKCEDRINEMKNQCIETIDSMNEEHKKEIDNLNEQLSVQSKKIEEMTTILDKANDEVDEIRKATKREVDEIYKAAMKEIEVAQAEVLALRLQGNKPPLPRDFVSKDRFDQLEAEIEALKAFEKQAWKEAKSEIRNNFFNQIASNEPVKKPKRKVKKHFEVTIERVVDDGTDPATKEEQRKKIFALPTSDDYVEDDKE